MGTIMLGLAAPTEAAALGAFGAIVLSAAYRRLSVQALRGAAVDCLRISSMIMLIVVAGTLYTGVFIAMGGGRVVQAILGALALSPYGYLALAMFVAFVGGFILEWISLLMLYIPIFIPFMVALGFDPVWFCTLFVICVQMSYVTPPMAPAIFYLRGIAPEEVSTVDMYRGIVPFVALQMIVLALAIGFPELVLWLPAKVYG